MNLFDKKNKITDTVYKVENFINVDFYDEYIEILKKINNLNFGAGWILNNCSLDELQDKIDTSKFKNRTDEEEVFCKKLDDIHSNKSDGSAATWIVQETESKSVKKITDQHAEMMNQKIPFNKSFYELCDKIIEYGNEKYGVDDWELCVRSHATYPPGHFINPHTHWPETEITAIIPLNRKPKFAVGGDLVLVDASVVEDYPTRSSDFFDQSGQGGIHVDAKAYENLVIGNMGHKRGDIYIFDDVLPLKNFIPPREDKYVYQFLDSYESNYACWKSTAHTITKVENWCRLSLLLFFESKKLKEYKNPKRRGSVLN